MKKQKIMTFKKYQHRRLVTEIAPMHWATEAKEIVDRTMKKFGRPNSKTAIYLRYEFDPDNANLPIVDIIYEKISN